jgi:hypothetical protein
VLLLGALLGDCFQSFFQTKKSGNFTETGKNNETPENELNFKTWSLPEASWVIGGLEIFPSIEFQQ